MTIIEQAFAKINLGLNVLGNRDDGYHSILSLFQTVGCSDTLEMSLYEKPGLVTNDPTIPTSKENLVLKSETVVRRYYPEIPKIKFTLKKLIPTGAGLGGGSADAAATLRGLSSIHRLDLDEKTLKMYASEIGSDVPFLVSGGTAIVTGRGEVVEQIEWPFRFTYVIVYPGIEISTAWAYRSLDPERKPDQDYETVIESLKEGTCDRDRFLRSLSNDFEKPVFAAYPDLAALKQFLLENGALAAILSGSGSALFGIFERETTAYHCANIIKMKKPLTYKVFTVQETSILTGT